MSGKRSRIGEEIVGLPLGAASDHERQAEIAVVDEGFEDGAVGGDDADAAVLLPQREGLPLGDRDLQPVGIKLEHGRVGDPRIGKEPRAGRVGVEEQQRGAAGHAGGGREFFRG